MKKPDSYLGDPNIFTLTYSFQLLSEFHQSTSNPHGGQQEAHTILDLQEELKGSSGAF